MTSYLSSYFTNSQPSNQYSQPTQPTQSTWTSTFSSRISTLRKALTKDSEEDSPDNEDASHVSNVLRAYYTEKGRPFPEWLPSDPFKPQLQTYNSQYGAQYGSQYGGQYSGQGVKSAQAHGRGGSGGRSGLSDLWGEQAQVQAVPQVQSLRARPGIGSTRSSESVPRHNESYSSSMQGGNPAGPRPMYTQELSRSQLQIPQSQSQAQIQSQQPTLGSRDRLRAKLQSGRSSNTASPDPYASQNSFEQRGSGQSYDGQGQYQNQGQSRRYG